MFWSFPLPCCFVFMFHTTKIIKLLVRRQLGISLLFRTAGDVAVVFFWWKPSSSKRASMCCTWSIFSVEVVGPVARVNQVPSHTRLLQRRGIKTDAKEPQKSLWFTDLHADPYYLTNIRNLPWFFCCCGVIVVICCDQRWWPKNSSIKRGIPEIRVNKKASSKDRFSLVAVAWMIHPMSWWLP